MPNHVDWTEDDRMIAWDKEGEVIFVFNSFTLYIYSLVAEAIEKCDNNRLKYSIPSPSLSAAVSLGAAVVRLMIRQALPYGEQRDYWMA